MLAPRPYPGAIERAYRSCSWCTLKAGPEWAVPGSSSLEPLIGEDGGPATVRWRSVPFAKHRYAGEAFEQFTASMIGHNLWPNPKVVGRVLHPSYMIRAKMLGIMMHQGEIVPPRDR